MTNIQDYQVLTSEGLFEEPKGIYGIAKDNPPMEMNHALGSVIRGIVLSTADIGEIVFNHTVNETNGNS